MEEENATQWKIRSFGISKRAFHFLLMASTITLSWLGMMVVHEFGHVVFSWISRRGCAGGP